SQRVGVAEELRGAQDEDRRSRILGELGGTIDLDEVLSRVLEAAGAIRGVDAALVRGGSGGEAIGLGRGPPGEEADARGVAGPPDGRTARSLTISYDYPD